MSLLDFHDSHHKKLNRAYFVHLIHVAKADGIISEKEKKVLHRLGHKLGFVDEEITRIIDNPGPDAYHPPYALKDRIQHLYDIIRITLADGNITDDERHITQCYAVASGFNSSESDEIIEIIKNGIANGLDEEEIFTIYSKRKK
jgi:uncharacterized tellurite resistance protein B-like protein